MKVSLVKMYLFGSQIVMTAMVVTLFSATANAQDTAVGTYLHGNWTIKGTVGEADVKGSMHVTPAADGESQMYRWTVNHPEGIRKGSAICGIDPKNGNVVEHSFGKDSYWTNTYEKNLGDSLGRTSGTRVGMIRGDRVVGKVSVDRKSIDQFQYDVVTDGADDVHFVFTRRKIQADGEAAFEAYADLAVGGTWKTTIKGVTYEDTYERIQDGKFVRLTSKAAGDFPASVTILGVDPVTKKFTWWGFAADGTQSQGTSRQIKKGVWVGNLNSNGPQGAMKSRGKLTKKGPDTIEYEILEQTSDDGVAVFEPVSTWKR